MTHINLGWGGGVRLRIPNEVSLQRGNIGWGKDR